MAKKKDKKKTLKTEERRTFVVIAVMILVTSLIVFGFSLAWILLNEQMNNQRIRREGTVELGFNDYNLDGLTIEHAFPMNEDGGRSREPFNVIVKNNGDEYVNYAIILKHDDDKHLKCKEENDGKCINVELDKIRYKIFKDGIEYDSKLLKDSMHVIDLGSIAPGEENTIDLDLQIWIDFEAKNIEPNSKFFGKLEVLTQTQ